MDAAEFKLAMQLCFPEKNGKPFYDIEGAHSEADSIMCDLLRELGYGDGVDIFQEANKWYA